MRILLNFIYSTGEGRWEQLKPTGDCPPSLQEHSAVAHQGNIYVFGGEVGFSSTETPLWVYDVKVLVHISMLYVRLIIFYLLYFVPLCTFRIIDGVKYRRERGQQCPGDVEVTLHLSTGGQCLFTGATKT